MFQTVFRSTVCFLFLIAALICCREQELATFTKPGVETLAVSKITESGAVFSASVNGGKRDPITDHGFIWSLESHADASSGEMISLGTLTNASRFETPVQRGLYADTTYYVKAYITTANHTVFGRVVSFNSKGSLPPAISKLIPSKGTWSDTVVVAGKNFSAVPSNVAVEFGGFKALVLASCDSSIQCIVPRDIAAESVPVKVTVTGHQSPKAVTFWMASPVINAIKPTTAAFEDTLVITGSGFSRLMSENKVRFNEYASRVIAASPESISVIVPPGLNHYENVISVQVNKQTATFGQKFTLTRPYVTSVAPLSGKPGTVVTITGAFFASHLAGNRVLFGGLSGKVLGARETEIKVAVPYDAAGEVSITVFVAGRKVETGRTFSVE